MLYRKFGNTGIDVSVLGFGAMRLPFTVKDGKNVYDYEESARIMQRANELGVNYFDTAPGYCDLESEAIVGQALKDIRSKVYISTKYYDENDSGRDCRKGIEQSLKQLGTSYIDFYHMWGINLDYFETKLSVPGARLMKPQKQRMRDLFGIFRFHFTTMPKT